MTNKLGRNVFLTNSDELQGRFKIGDSDVLYWKSVNLSNCTYAFLVEGVGLNGGALGPTAHLVSDVATLKLLWEEGSPGMMDVHQIYVIPPRSLRKAGCSMEPLSEIRVLAGSDLAPVYEFVTDTGHVFTSDQV
ncbi:hypothetical protein CXQ80_10985 [Pseudomonas sp. 02C 26]|nr:hypothetical protein CXQ80_10985 [Pseudomonas sp. 02C 26]